MSRLHETAPLLQYPAAASHFQPPSLRTSEWSAPNSRQPYQAIHIQHRNNLIKQQQRERDREQQHQRQQQQQQQQQQHNYTFAPHESHLLYDHEDDEERAREDEDDDSGQGDDSLTLQRVQHSTQTATNGAASATNGALSGGSDISRHTAGAMSYGSTAQTAVAALVHGSGSVSGSRGESQSQPHSPVASALRSNGGYQTSALPLPPPRLNGLTDIKDLNYTPSSSPAPFLQATSSHPVRLALYLLLSVVIAVANAITWKRTLNRFRATDGSSANLEFFVTEWTILLYVVLAALILAYRWLFTSLITAEQKAYPQRKFALMGLMDAVAGLCSSLGGAFTSGQTQVILNQANIPVTMLLSRSFLASNYTLTQYFGAALIVAGSLLAAVPSSGGSDSADGSSSSALWYGPLILLISCLPNSFSNVYKEKNFKVDGLDVFYLTTSVSVWQVLLGFLFCPILSLPGLGGLSLSDLPTNFSQGWSCFLGGFVDGFECHLSPPPYVVLLLYVVVNFFYNVLLLLITKHGSALLLVIASAISLPFTNLVFTSELFMGREAEAWSWWTGGGLVVVVVGFLLYSLVTDSDTGDWLPAQGAAGQMAYILEEPVELHKSFNRARRHSFDVTDSPLVVAHLQERKRLAKQRYLQQRKSSRAAEAGEMMDDTNIGSNSDNERLFFTPP